MQLTSDDWIRAGLETLSQSGIASVKIEAIARKLKISKGSFYHYFRDRAELLEAMFFYWEVHLTREVIREMENSGMSAKEQFQALVYGSFSHTIRLQSAILAWANQDEQIAERVKEIEQERVQYIERLFNEMGLPPAESKVRAEISYFTFLGWIDRSSRNPALKTTQLADAFINFITQMS
ncbi:TetR family transcriptional regulator [Paenibacillus sp. SYP-B3998]|uniref:TetR family transcriptional regulator n=1 Tax=Paenibacillus sp. SYP-B3998 TaxID=2678564 RepID=A0A6G3ZZ66_9BACL|nr:TetR/AcrR family transcriptional regulator [Paenibacillus sp. SYP-B3998]NEW07390.1 TetR family transcriptional regulator [Paenibacillus sp. SYP-B3998]